MLLNNSGIHHPAYWNRSLLLVAQARRHWKLNDIKNNAWVTVNSDFFGHEWGDLPMIFTSGEVTSENHWQIISRVTNKSLFTVTNVLFYFLHAIYYLEHHSATSNHRSLISPLSLRTLFSNLTLWRHHGWSVTSREREALALWRHIRLLFLHAQIGDLH